MSNYPPSFSDSTGPQFPVFCPHCRTTLTVAVNQAGSVATCPNCSGSFQVPAAPPSNGMQPSNYPNSTYGTGGYGGGYGASGYGQGGYGYSSPGVRDFASKKVAAGICGILFGGLGVHKFILGFNGAGTIMLSVWLISLVTGMCIVVPIFACIALNIIGLIEGIIYLTKSDEEFYQIYAVQRKEWF